MTDWEEFLKRYYWEKILDLARDYPEKKSLIIEFSDIERYDLDAGYRLLERPDDTIQELEKALKTIDLPADIEAWCPKVRIANIPEKIKRRNLREEHVNHLLCLDGIVQRVAEVVPRIIRAAFQCRRCEHITYLYQEENRFVEPFECDNEVCARRGPFKLLPDESEKIDSQMIRIQELPEDLRGGEKSQTIDVSIESDLTGLLLPGNKVTVTGILRAYQRTRQNGKTPYFDFFLEANHVQINESQESVVLTADDKKRMHALASCPDIIDRLVDSFGTTIHGMREVKEGILCSAVSSGLKQRPDGTPQREYSHVLVCSDPGMAKSNLKHALKKIMPGIGLSSGTGSTKAGLTAAAIKDDFAGGSWSIEAGALPLADGAGLVIDEFDKLHNEDKKQLNDALSNCQFEIHKAGFHLKLWTRCFVVALLNPKHGRFDDYGNIADQIDIPPDTLSRFDLIFIIKDAVSEIEDKLVAEQMAKAWTGQDTAAEGLISVEDLQKYIALAQTIQPEYSKEVSETIVSRFIWARSKSREGRVAVTRRYVESLFRLSKAEAQLALSNTVTLKHLDRAIKLLEASILQVGVDEKGNIDADIIAAGRSKSQRDKIRLITSLIKDLSRNSSTASIGELVFEAEKAGIQGDELKVLIERMKLHGDLYEPKQGFLKVV